MFTDHSGQRERVKAGEGDDRGWDSWMASMSLSKLQELVMDREAWRAQSMGLQRVGHD